LAHVPLQQVWLPAQATPHCPQFLVLDVSATQDPLQQVLPEAQTLPQPLQLFSSLVGLMQTPEQQSSPLQQLLPFPHCWLAFLQEPPLVELFFASAASGRPARDASAAASSERRGIPLARVFTS
jgi:hypothetical protein